MLPGLPVSNSVLKVEERFVPGVSLDLTLLAVNPVTMPNIFPPFVYAEQDSDLPTVQPKAIYRLIYKFDALQFHHLQSHQPRHAKVQLPCQTQGG